MIGARVSPNETSRFLFVASDSVVSTFTWRFSIGVAVSSSSTPLFEIVPRLVSWLPENPDEGATATGMSASRVVFE